MYIPRIEPHDRLNSRLASAIRNVLEDISVESIAASLPLEVDDDQDGRVALRDAVSW